MSDTSQKILGKIIELLEACVDFCKQQQALGREAEKLVASAQRHIEKKKILSTLHDIDHL